MRIITTPTFIAGIFTDPADAEVYIRTAPAGSDFNVLDVDLVYPFWLLETEQHVFRPYQTKSDAFAQPDATTIFRIERDYRPEVDWTDWMGGLPHEHPRG